MSSYRFAWDVSKSERNLEKHGIDFDEGTRLWDDPNKTETPQPRKGELRWKLHARYAGAVWIAIYTQRTTIIRIISVRRANRNEVAYYDRTAAKR